MRKTFKRIAYFFCVFCFLLTTLFNSGLITSAEVVWEENYHKTQLEYYAGSAATKSMTDNSFSDWAGSELVEINSLEHPENWQNTFFTNSIAYNYALAWDTSYVYLYIEIDRPLSALTASYTRFYFDVTPETNSFTGWVEYTYNSSTNNIVVNRAHRYNNTNDPTFAANIGLHVTEIDGKTCIETKIPWSGMNQAFTPTNGANIKYNLCILADTDSTYLYVQDSSVWTTNNMPWQKSTYYLTMFFSTGTPNLTPITPTALTTSTILTSAYKELNAALGMTYTGTVGTHPNWQNFNVNLLTEGSFQDVTTISGDYMEGFQGTGTDGSLTANIEDDGTIVKIIDLGSVVNGLYKFKIGSAQVSTDGILFPSQVKVYASQNSFHYQYLGTATEGEYNSSDASGVLKELQRYNVELTEGVSARYIKIKITPPASNYNIVAISEISAIYNVAVDEEVVIDPIISLGAKVNIELNGLRFGAQFNKNELKEVEKIGMLMFPTSKLGSNTLDMAYYNANPYTADNQSGVILISAVAIAKSDFVMGKAFNDYETFNYFITLLNIPETNLTTNVTAVPFTLYKDGSISYGAPLVRNYSAVLDAIDAIQE
ncbi:MAG: hypothetical protein A2Y15_09250 [Clostridiales bacterium GWF2_36_10]|nr:MAG: hypothetical protein A2Y15_09250 [Clostridiales bacterium GWF2_36_10]HAN21434.1 hypothetical protein [Clostridiales bacterium]